MLDLGKTTVKEAFRNSRAIGAFSIYNLEGAQAVCRAAESESMPTILQAGSSAFRYGGRDQLAALALAAAESSGTRVGVHLDHSRDLSEIRKCLEFGYTSVMVDGSHLPFEDNVILTRKAAREARNAGAWIEAELGGLTGNEDRSSEAQVSSMTDPEQAARFVDETGVDALAVAIGNVHGFTPQEPSLDLERLAKIRDLVSIPLVLHGASGLAEGQIEDAIALGVAKINVNAELRRAFIGGVRDSINCLPTDDDSISSLLAPVTERMQWIASEKIRLFCRVDEVAKGALAGMESKHRGGAS